MQASGIRRQLVEAVAATVHVGPDEIDPSLTFDAIGFDSLNKVGIVPKLEQLFGCTLESEVLFDHPTVDSLVEHILDILSRQSRGLT